MFDNDDLEILDVVNDKDEVIGTIKRGDMMSLKDTPGRYLRAVDIFIQRSDGNIYLPRRSIGKKIAPGGLDTSAAGHILSGETYEEACLREIKEEVGIDIAMDDLILIGKFKPTPTLFYFRNVYLLRTDVEPTLSPEHTEAFWVPVKNLEAVVRADIPTKQSLIPCIQMLVDYLDSH